MVILVTGGDGQLGKCIKDASNFFDSGNEYYFLSKNDFDLTNKEQMAEVFEKLKPEIVINCAAYTGVDSAEDNSIIATGINYLGVEDLVKLCESYNSHIIHISTDYVFSAKSSKPFKEEMPTKKPLNVYGATKLAGDTCVMGYKNGIVIRTSWLYSEYGKNFYKTMLERIRSERETKVVNDQIGTPTYARDLAKFITNDLISSGKITEIRGLYNFSNNGSASWYDFASTIEMFYSHFGPYEPIRKCGNWVVNFNLGSYKKSYIEPTTTKEYKTKAKRPQYSVLDKTKVENEFGIKIPHWIDSLFECMRNDGIISELSKK